jgi:hypothetical protein
VCLIGLRRMIRSKKITNAARGEHCALQIVGACNGDPATVVFCHLPDETHGIGIKSDDLSGCFGCSGCHDVVDGRRYWQEFDDNGDFYMRRAQTRTMRRLFELGVFRIA